jgi:uncharacterized protein YjaZ
VNSRDNINLYILNASGKLTPYLKEIQNIFNKTIIKVLKKIPLSSVDVVVCEFAKGAIPELGIGGRTHSSNLIFIYLDTKFPNFVNITLNKELERTIVHELSHSIRWKTIGYGETLLKASISEGLADHLDMEINNSKPHLWDIALNADQMSKIMEKAKRKYNSKDYNHSEWFYGIKEKSVPRWAGYTLGFNLIAEYLKKNPSKKPSQLHGLKAEEFIK